MPNIFTIFVNFLKTKSLVFHLPKKMRNFFPKEILKPFFSKVFLKTKNQDKKREIIYRKKIKKGPVPEK